MTGPAYPAARGIAALVQEYFARHIALTRQQGETALASEPDAATVEEIIATAFWASLRREEGRPPKISLAFLSPEQARHPMRFERWLPLSAESLVRVAPAVERPGIHLGVWRENGELRVWGATRTIPYFCLVVEVVEPGLLVVKHRRAEEFGKFGNVAVLQGDRIRLVDEQGASLPDCPALLSSLLAFESPGTWRDPVNVLVQLATSMRAHRRGGSLLVVPHGTERWQESMVRPMAYRVEPAFAELAVLMRRDASARAEAHWKEEVLRAVDAVAGLTAVDGATVISSEYDVLAFGAKIRRAQWSASVERVMVTEPIEGDVATVMPPTLIGGTRHLSAAQFVHDQQDAVALVASQDGRFTVFAWSPCEGMVHAHRVEALLL